jgi:hypothetical protein
MIWSAGEGVWEKWKIRRASLGRAVVEHLLKVMTQLRQAITELDPDIARTFKVHPGALIVSSFHGAGPVLAPAYSPLWAAAARASLRQRFAVLHRHRSDHPQHTVHRRPACPQFVRQTMQEWAQHSMTRSGWARCVYQRQRAATNPIMPRFAPWLLSGFAFSTAGGNTARLTTPRYLTRAWPRPRTRRQLRP